MKVVILAGGLGTRIGEDSHLKPKPMLEIGEKPILWHIMKEYSYYGFDEFIICCGFKQNVIKEWFADYYLHCSDITFDFSNKNSMFIHNNVAEPWKVTLVDTGLLTQTGGRIKKIKYYVGNETFMLTYGDGVSDVNIAELLAFHKKGKVPVTLTAVHSNKCFGIFTIDEQCGVWDFREKHYSDNNRINGGYMVLEPEIFNHILGDEDSFEKDVLYRLLKMGKLKTYQHNGFWMSIDSQRDRVQLEELWECGKAPWKKWS